ncbi:MAG: 3-oxo-5-alpha-steroid 4-dehydrogenase [Byssovorax sp.]
MLFFRRRIALLAIVFNLMNGYLNGRWLNTLSPPYPSSWLTDPRFLVGVTLFVAGYLINRKSDEILRRLRAPGEAGYKIPVGGLYRWVSSPNYFGEMIEWTGFAVATWSLPGLAFALWTAANLAPRAISHHRWYRDRFPDYPAERRALIPYLL